MPLHFRLQDLPDRFHKQVEEQLRQSSVKKPTLPKPQPPKNPDRPLGRPSPLPTTTPSKLTLAPASPKSRFSAPLPRNLRASKMTKPEIAFNRDFLENQGLFEGITLKLPGGDNYTPDFVCLLDGHPTVVECKGSFRLQSEGRAHTAFFEAAANFSWLFTFVWAVYQKGGSWDIKHVIPCDPKPNVITSPNNNINNINNNDCVCVSGVMGCRGKGDSPSSSSPESSSPSHKQPLNRS